MSDQILVKQLFYRSTHRGCKETDFLIGEFAKVKLQEMVESDLLLFGKFLEEDDLEIYDWILQKAPAPEKYSGFLVAIRNFHRI